MDSGFLLVCKPPGITSSDLVLKVKKGLKLSKIGHTGTLDKFAEGLMILPFGQYTVFSGHFLGQNKRYLAKIKFGIFTDSGDPNGTILAQWETNKTEKYFLENKNKIEREIQNISLQTTQIPPKVSALKVKGKRQSDLYREGIEFKSEPRKISVYDLQFSDLSYKGFNLNIHVSSGTYIRKIVMDLSEKLEFPMHLVQLIRTEIGNQNLEMSQTLEEVILSPKIIPWESMIPFPVVEVGEEDKKLIRNGRYVRFTKPIESENFLIKNQKDNELLAWCSLKKNKNDLPYSYVKVFIS